MHVDKTIQQEYAYNLKIDYIAHELGGTEEQKDIGVIIYSNLEFDKTSTKKVTKQIVSWQLLEGPLQPQINIILCHYIKL